MKFAFLGGQRSSRPAYEWHSWEKTVVGPAPMTWSSHRAELPDQGCEERFMSAVDDYTNVCGSLRRVPYSQESSERLSTRTFQESINAESMLRALPTSTGPHKRSKGHPETVGLAGEQGQDLGDALPFQHIAADC